MESRDWRYGWATDDPRWSEASAPDPTNGNPYAAPDLWGEPPPAAGPPAPTYHAYGNPSVTSTGGIPALRGPTGPHSQVRSGYGLTPPPPGRVPGPPMGYGAFGDPGPSFGPPGRTAPPPRPRGRTAQRAEAHPDKPAYQTVIALTAGWYLVPAVVYVVWLLTVGTTRQSSSGPGIVGSLPWIGVAVVLSLMVAVLLRWAIVGWRALTLSFAAAVIGAGVATIAHSLSL